MRHLIVCCDGTWNTPEMESVTNVRRLYNALDRTDEGGHRQLSWYQPGVGSLRNRLLGGAFGLGLSDNVMDAYRWLAGEYRPGDRIWLFGFSRGAYTARSLAGMVSACGLIDTAALDEATARRKIEQIYDHGYRKRGADRRWRQGLTFRYDPDDRERIPVHFVGVWDTVGSLGVPDYLGWLNLLDPSRGDDFHDLRLNPHIRHARHAVAMDERRGPFVPALWAEPFADGQDVKQVWFPGSHQDVGGGHPRTGLSDGALRWMIDEVRGSELPLGFRRATVDQIRPDPLDVLHDDDRGLIGVAEPLSDLQLRPLLEVALQPRPRAVPKIDPSTREPDVHQSAYDRQRTPPISTGPYRPTRVLAPGRSETVEVFAGEPWNETGLYLEAGDYDFAAEGEWLDGDIVSGPAGTCGPGRFNPLTERLRLVRTLLGGVERLFGAATGNRAARSIGARRDVRLPWMSLVGAVANDAIRVKGDATAHERIAIGEGTRHRVRRSGYLYTFANDAWGSSGSNRGSVRLTVTMVSADHDERPRESPARLVPGLTPWP
ncbi:DUF2235 domain-containing protein [Actinomadura chokoriensis]|uniref:DUF2235 domain-containing protein n=1 Tax=Actinomadura chokoriensis TaxID=454156 RepID=A0ABV4QU09_9ACTN